MAATNYGDLAHLRRDAAVDLRSDVDALHALEEELTRHGAVSETMIRTLTSAGSLVETLETVDSNGIRPALTAAIRKFERSRHRARLQLIAVAMAEGATDRDVRHLWNISNEMVRRAKRELTSLDDAD
jgi:hypothetical protein